MSWRRLTRFSAGSADLILRHIWALHWVFKKKTKIFFSAPNAVAPDGDFGIGEIGEGWGGKAGGLAPWMHVAGERVYEG